MKKTFKPISLMLLLGALSSTASVYATSVERNEAVAIAQQSKKSNR
ncbi:MAG: hypothetical protein LUI85_18155 [Bacteroides sp.]|nr:hypothetical protein [Bacteroides sp.]